jgi:uncharacterized membrane protein YccC
MTAPPLSPPVTQPQLASLISLRRGRASFGVAIRAAIAVVTPVVLAQLLAQPLYIWAALGAYTTCLADVLDTYEGKLHMSTVVTVGSAVVAVIGGIAGSWPAPAVVAVMFVVTYMGTAARGLGRVAGTAAYFVLVTFVVALGAGTTPSAALLRGVYVLGGGVWGTLLILSRWLVQAEAPVLIAAAFPYAGLTRLARLILRQESGGARAERAALREHRAVRDAIVVAHDAIAHLRPGTYPDALHAMVDDADRLFGVVLALGEAIRATTGAERERLRVVAHNVERLTDALETNVATGIAPNGATRSALEALGATIATVERESAQYEVTALVATLRRSATHAVESATTAASHRPAASAVAPPPATPRGRLWRDRLRTIRDIHVTPESPVLRHAGRVAVACAVSEILALSTGIAHGYWITLTILVVLQPDLGTTVRRGAQRIIGTAAGGVIAAVLAAALPRGIVTAFVLAPLLVVTIMLLPIHYTLFATFLTPTFVLFSETHPGDWELALVRVTNTLLGGVLALAAAFVLWPRSERGRVGGYLAALLRAAAAYIRVVATAARPMDTDEWMTLRAALGRANTAAEDSVLRWRAERVTSTRGVRSAAALVLNSRALGASSTWMAIVGTHAARDTETLLAIATQLDTLAQATASHDTPSLPPLPASATTDEATPLIDARLRTQLEHITAAALRYIRATSAGERTHTSD